MTIKEYAVENNLALPTRKDEDFKNTRVEDFFTFEKELFISKELEKVNESSLNIFEDFVNVREKISESGEIFHLDLLEKRVENRFLEIEVKENEQLTVTNYVQAEDYYYFKNYKILVKESARLNLFLLNQGGANLINFVDIVLEDNAVVNVYGLEDLKENNLHSNIVKVKHLGVGSVSNQLFKYILDGKSKGVYGSSVVIEKSGVKSDVSQLVKGLILSEEVEAKINTRPHLEIYVDDVKASHGSAIGALDEEALFYLKARGLNDEKAREILVDSFRGEILELLPTEHREKVEFYEKR